SKFASLANLGTTRQFCRVQKRAKVLSVIAWFLDFHNALLETEILFRVVSKFPVAHGPKIGRSFCNVPGTCFSHGARHSVPISRGFGINRLKRFRPFENSTAGICDYGPSVHS